MGNAVSLLAILDELSVETRMAKSGKPYTLLTIRCKDYQKELLIDGDTAYILKDLAAKAEIKK